MTPLLPILNDRFRDLDHYRKRTGSSYAILPCRFIALDERRYVLTNFVGEYVVLLRDVLYQFVRHQLDQQSPQYLELKSKHFLLDGDSTVSLDLLAVKYRTKQSLLANLTSLFIFVVSLRCDHSCPYCQVSRQSLNRQLFDMKWEDAAQAIEFMFRSPSPSLKVEFQGGESLLNFDLIKQIVLQVETINETEQRELQFVIATNLAYLTDEVLSFCLEHNIFLSTSLDGPRELHNRNRPRPGGDSYELTIQGITKAREVLGHDHVSALMTTTEASLRCPEEIIDEYVRQGFSSLFLRPLSPYGFAVKTGAISSYDVQRWLVFYKRALSHIIELDRQGIVFQEEYTSLVLRKILTPFPASYVDLQSPAGIGIAAIVFNYDGAIYASDEARMLAETGDMRFRLGHLKTDSFESVMTSQALIETISDSMTEGTPMCVDCGFQPYCGSDPVFHYATQKDIVGFKPTSDFCRKNMEIFRHVIRLLEDDPVSSVVLRKWI